MAGKDEVKIQSKGDKLDYWEGTLTAMGLAPLFARSVPAVIFLPHHRQGMELATTLQDLAKLLFKYGKTVEEEAKAAAPQLMEELSTSPADAPLDLG